MELIEAIKARRSIRKFKPDPIAEEDLQAILEAARLAPSGTNLQPWRFVVVKSPEARARLNESTPLPFVGNAPAVIVVCVDTQAVGTMGNRVSELREAGAFVDTPLQETKSESYSRAKSMDEAAIKAYLSLNAAIAIDHITLRAVDLGLGTCWVMMFDQAKVREALALEEHYNVVALIPVGKPDQEPKARPRLPLAELVLKEL